MRSLGLSLSRPFGRQAALGMVIAGAALLNPASPRAVAAAPDRGRANPSAEPDGDTGRGDELAFAAPRVATFGGRWGGVGVPLPLDPVDAARIRAIFEAQAHGDLAAADGLLGLVSDHTLLGDILADRYLRDGARPTASVLTAWLKSYGDQADAPAIWTALRRAAPRSASLPPAPAFATLGSERTAQPAPEEADPALRDAPPAPELRRAVLATAEAGRIGPALRLIARARIPTVTGAALRADVARVLLTRGQNAQALSVGRDASARSDGRVGAAAYVAGLAAWQLGRTAEAATWFERASRASLIAESTRAGAAFWAARAHLALGDPGGYRPWMLRAAAARRTFYGLLASRRLGIGGWSTAGDDVGEETLGEADVEAIAATPQGRRVFALLQVGQARRAEAELRVLWPHASGDLALCRSIMLVAQAAGLADLAAQIASILQGQDGHPRDAARFPVPRLAPRGGFTIDPALVYALTRVESNFDPAATSGAGAQGLMQLMPQTASEMMPGAGARWSDRRVNLQLGQLYVDRLAASQNVQGDLIRLLAGYNSGPGRIGEWPGVAGDGSDPLMWMETIPADETRDFVHRTFAYLWIYAARIGLPAPSLDSLAAGIRPSYVEEAALAGARFALN